MLLKLKDILPNPNRDLRANPLDAAKIDELVASINTTGFWDNVVVRKNQEGKYELAYGHHRLAAAIKAGLVEADFIVKKLDDELMIKVMDNENREAYGSSPLSLIESVKAVVKGLTENRVKPFNIDPKVRKDAVRYAPSFVPKEDVRGSSPQMAYTAMSIAKFLGRTEALNAKRIKPEDSVVAALNALHLMELGHLKNAELFKEKLVRPPEGGKATEVKVPLTTNELLTLTSEIKRDVERVRLRENKTAEEAQKIERELRELEAKRKADAKKAEEEHKALLKKLADAERAENEKKADALKARLKADDKRAQEKEVLNKLRAAELDEKLKKKKEWEEQQRQQDEYLPLRRDVENFIKRYETKITESNSEREDVKALNRTLAGGVRLAPADRARAQRAVRDYANWLYDWVLPQLSPELKAAQKRTVDARKVTQPKPKTKGGA